MTAAFILAINMFVAALFAIAFGFVAATNRNARGARWLSFGYALGIIDVALEYILPYHSHPFAVEIAIFLVYLLALTACIIGIARHYGSEPPWVGVILLWGASLAATPLIFGLEYGTVLQLTLYQLPYFLMHLLGFAAVLRSRRRHVLDIVLMVAVVFGGLVYLAKPLIAWQIGTASSPQGYIATSYAAISQTLGTGTLVAIALVLLAVIMRDTTAEMLARSETDLLSGALNRRGFNRHAAQAMDDARGRGEPVVMIAADLDHFKMVNDSFGHAAGDSVIAHFARLLEAGRDHEAIISRTGGEEFALLVPGADLAGGRQIAEEVRARFAAARLPKIPAGHPLSASFGVAQMVAGDSLFDLWLRADAALYRAKSGGRNQVRVALGEVGSETAIDAA